MTKNELIAAVAERTHMSKIAAASAVEATFSGAHLLHLAAAGCVLNDIYREAATLDIQIDGLRVSAAGGFDTERGHRLASPIRSR